MPAEVRPKLSQVEKRMLYSLTNGGGLEDTFMHLKYGDEDVRRSTYGPILNISNLDQRALGTDSFIRV